MEILFSDLNASREFTARNRTLDNQDTHGGSLMLAAYSAVKFDVSRRKTPAAS
jgi:hypothetical protein